MDELDLQLRIARTTAMEAARLLRKHRDTDDTKAYRAAEITMRFAAEMAAELIEKRKKNAEGK